MNIGTRRGGKRDSASTVERAELKKRIVGFGSSSSSPSTPPRSEFSSLFQGSYDDQTPKRTSMTRPRFLPPKDLEEEERHLREYEEMMSQYQSKVGEEERKVEIRRREKLEKEEKIIANTKRWEDEILPFWEQKKNLRGTRDLWWQGLPPRLREKIWIKASGNKVQVTPHQFMKLAKEGQAIRLALELEEQEMEQKYRDRIKSGAISPPLSDPNVNPSGDQDLPLREAKLERLYQKEEDEAHRVSETIQAQDEDLRADISNDEKSDAIEKDKLGEEPLNKVEAVEVLLIPHQPDDKEVLSPPIEKKYDVTIKVQEDLDVRVDTGTDIKSAADVKEGEYRREEMRTESLNLLGKKSVNQIIVDLPRTFPALSFFQEHGPYYPGLRQVLEAYSVLRPDIGYVQGMSYIAAALLLNLEPFDAFQCMCNLLSSKLLTSFYKMNTGLMERVFRAFDMMLKKHVPQIHYHFQAKGVFHALYLIDWLLTVYTKSLPIDIASRILDIYFFEGEYFLFRAALGILKYLEPDLIHNDFDGILKILQRLNSKEFDIDALFEAIHSIQLTGDETRATLIKAKSVGNEDGYSGEQV